MRTVPKVALDFVAEHEGLRLDSYEDQGGTWTVGYGHTGPEVHAGLRITEAKAKGYLALDLATAAARLAGVVKREVIDSLTEHQYAALLSFVLNLGANSTWTIWKRLNAKAYDQIPVEMMRFVYIGKAKVAGLVNRRAAEVALWSTGEPGSVPDEPPSSYSRAEPTPPTPAPAKPQFLAQAAQAIGGASAGAVMVQQVVAPHVSEAEVLGKIVGAIAIFITVCGVIMLAIHYLEKRQAAR